MAVSPLATWFSGDAAVRRFRARRIGRAPAMVPARDAAWRALAPRFSEWPAIARSGLPFQTVAERRYDRSGDPGRLRRALSRGETAFFPQIHQVLPRVARLMAALRAELLPDAGEATSFLFLSEGRGREGMGLHHDGEVDGFWIQLEGRRTVTLGPPVGRRAPADLADAHARRPGFSTVELPAGALLYLPPRTPHRVVYHERSVALSLTWARARRRRARGASPEWDVASGWADRVPPASHALLWTQVPAVAGRGDGREFPLSLPGEVELRLPAAMRPLALRLAAMPRWRVPRTGGARADLERLREAGILGRRDLPLLIVPDRPRALDGWRFA